jgi:3-methyladenine DNA glycosylase AlkD
MTEIQKKQAIIKDYCLHNSNPDLATKTAYYFKEGYDAYGMTTQQIKAQSKIWFKNWKTELSPSDFLTLANALFHEGKYEEGSFAIGFIGFLKNFPHDLPESISNWLESDVKNWAHADTIAGHLLRPLIKEGTVDLNLLEKWSHSPSKWKRRTVAVSFIYALENNWNLQSIFTVLDPLMSDNEKVVHQGLGWFLRKAWEKHPQETEAFLLKWKDHCARLIIQYATEKMVPEQKVLFKKSH